MRSRKGLPCQQMVEVKDLITRQVPEDTIQWEEQWEESMRDQRREGFHQWGHQEQENELKEKHNNTIQYQSFTYPIS